ncbi:UDP-Glycosyltransferase superfamily protein [Abeliophyllum distichum]|uniref:UDP-Glycosyltransferase superfamily protein n=1 Tax=Abeliophyllum distichum TaxID=126358 RepID=A0ABD1PML1_9LAMI
MATIFHSSLPPSPHAQSRLPLSRNARIINCVSLDQTRNASSSTAATSSAANDSLRVIFAAGGTGGHIYPAVAIADALKSLNPKTQFLFVGTAKGMEAKAVPFSGYPFVAVPAAPLTRPLFSLNNFLILPYIITKSTFKSFKILREFDPHVVIGTGGFVSFPTCLAAALKGVKLVIQEQNSVSGIANLVLSLFADKIFVAYDSTIESFPQRSKCVVCGNPVRLSLMEQVSKTVARQKFFPNVAAKEGLGEAMLNECEDLFIIWQTGVEAFSEMESLARNHPRVVLTPFLHALDLAYAAADLVVSRAGAMTCYEILATGKPCILIPSPYVAEGHQLKNASLMADLAGSRVIMENELDSTILRTAIQEMLDNKSLMAEMSKRALRAAKPNSSAEIAQQILSLVNNREVEL